MSPRDGEEFADDLLAAKERDLKPLLEESREALGLGPDQITTMEPFLDSAWFSGMRAGYDQVEARATQHNPDIGAIATERFEAEFKTLMEQAAERLNLTLDQTIGIWDLLHRAWMAGNRSSEAELIALYIEVNSDVAEEVRKWLEDGGDPTSQR